MADLTARAPSNAPRFDEAEILAGIETDGIVSGQHTNIGQRVLQGPGHGFCGGGLIIGLCTCKQWHCPSASQ